MQSTRILCSGGGQDELRNPPDVHRRVPEQDCISRGPNICLFSDPRLLV